MFFLIVFIIECIRRIQFNYGRTWQQKAGKKVKTFPSKLFIRNHFWDTKTSGQCFRSLSQTVFECMKAVNLPNIIYEHNSHVNNNNNNNNSNNSHVNNNNNNSHASLSKNLCNNMNIYYKGAGMLAHTDISIPGNKNSPADGFDLGGIASLTVERTGPKYLCWSSLNTLPFNTNLTLELFEGDLVLFGPKASTDSKHSVPASYAPRNVTFQWRRFLGVMDQ